MTCYDDTWHDMTWYDMVRVKEDKEGRISARDRP